MWNALADVETPPQGCVVSVGNFDGVHRGHMLLLEKARARANESDLPLVVVAFDPHPLAVVRPDQAPDVLTDVEYRAELLLAAGADHVLLMPFTLDVSQWSAQRFIDEVLVNALAARGVVVGADFRFGHRGLGSVSDLQQVFGDTSVDAVADVLDDSAEHGRRWSSTWVREALAAGQVGEAARVLGRWHRVNGVVVHGDHRGRELGYPTANLDSRCMIPADGVYAGWLVRSGLPSGAEDQRLPAAVHVGTNSTFDGVHRRVEAYVLDRDDLDLYGEDVGVDFVQQLRGTVKFDGVEPLLVQMKVDVDQCRRLLVG